MKRLPREFISTTSDRNTAELAKNQESLGEQETSLANLNVICSDAQTTYDVSHAERLAENQTLLRPLRFSRRIRQTQCGVDAHTKRCKLCTKAESALESNCAEDKFR